MALFDAPLFSDNQALTATAASTNVRDFGAAGTPVGWAGPIVGDLGLSDIEILVQVTETFNNLTSLAVSVQMDDNEAFASPTTLVASNAIALASLVAGYKFAIPCELPERTTERYIRLYYTIVGTAPTAGKVFAGVVAARPMV